MKYRCKDERNQCVLRCHTNLAWTCQSSGRFVSTSVSLRMGCLSYNWDGDGWRIWKYEFDLLELLATTPVLCERNPSSTTITKTMGHDDSGSVLRDCGDGESWWWRHFVNCELWALQILEEEEDCKYRDALKDVLLCFPDLQIKKVREEVSSDCLCLAIKESLRALPLPALSR